jgi:2-keto-4-pentenoate hydratase/2-oxohepta-3-ene-1,7-dioic acid hydratase in catechol pathway
MQILRLREGGTEHWARRVDETSARLWTDAPYRGGVETDRVVPLRDLLAPVLPSKVVCVGRNYAAHAKELGNEVPAEPLLFLKPPSAVLGPGGTIVLPSQSQRVEHEGELCVVIGRRLSRASEADARSAVLGITAANDVTARDLQKRDVQFTRGKGFDTFCPVGPWIETSPGDLTALSVTTRVNGAVRQHGSTSAMIFPVATLLSYISHVMTLEPGDIVLTGTPEGVGPLVEGDTVEVEIEGVGAPLSNRVSAQPSS